MLREEFIDDTGRYENVLLRICLSRVSLEAFIVVINVAGKHMKDGEFSYE